jgi:hypothetical protein
MDRRIERNSASSRFPLQGEASGSWVGVAGHMRGSKRGLLQEACSVSGPTVLEILWPELRRPDQRFLDFGPSRHHRQHVEKVPRGI